MAEADEEAPWDDQTDSIINDINKTVSKKYYINFRDLLLNPGKYVTQDNFPATFQSIRKEVTAYFENLLEGMKDEQERLSEELDSLTSQYQQIDSVISNKASLSRIPYIKSATIERPENEEAITIQSYEPGIEALIGKLISISNYVADISTSYGKSVFGSWLFSGQKNYTLSLQVPDNRVLSIQISRDTINSMLDMIGTLI
ncbi:MAG: hypothetical protein ACP5TJ_02690 [Candidatus Micrarchaeia archaeon]